MGSCSVQNKVCVLVSCALLLTCGVAQRDYFLMSSHLTWQKARERCQDCFKDLVTVTSDNIFKIANKVSNTSWIGLRKINNTWSRWANGDPLTFQNWSPDTDAQATLSTSCVAMLTLGVWVEMNCNECLPFICYEDRFFGGVTLTKRSTSSAALSWLAGPGAISNYRLEVDGSQNITVQGTSWELQSLTPGTSHSVKVFANKCKHELNPAEISFYTFPEKVQKLHVSVVTENSLSLAWTKPSGNVDFYQVEVDSRRLQRFPEDVQVGGLTPGRSYTIAVKSAVLDGKALSTESTIIAFTKPVKVTGLKVCENTNSYMLLCWELSMGEATAFKVEAKRKQQVLFERTVVNQTQVKVTSLPQATQIYLSVTALAGGATAETATISSYSVPGLVSNLTLYTDKDDLTATWSHRMAENYYFTVRLQRQGQTVEVRQKVLNSSVLFSKLRRGVNYTVSVSIVTGGVRGPSVEDSTYTTPLPVTNIKVVSFDQHQITFTWTSPPDSENLEYFLKLTSMFWRHSYSKTVRNKNVHTFSGLKSGTTYQLDLRTTVGQRSSDPVSYSQSTVADKIEVSLSMLCSSADVLWCDKHSTRDDVFKQLNEFFKERFGNNIFWKLEEQQSLN